MNDNFESFESEIPREVKEYLEGDIPPQPPLIPITWGFWVRLSLIPVVIALFVYFNFIGKPEFLQDTTWLLVRFDSNNEPIYMLWDFDKSGDLLIVFPSQKEDYTLEENCIGYSLAGDSRIQIKKKNNWLAWFGEYKDVTKQEDGAFLIELKGANWHGYPLEDRYPKDDSMNRKYQYFSAAQIMHRLKYILL